mmetsp:Transcript_99454/g.172636  ORF Transcript_99454/g.172636 Transcript_99454/m.172636 type:complete len:177 (-) Transcript_99454:19-549(-)
MEKPPAVPVPWHPSWARTWVSEDISWENSHGKRSHSYKESKRRSNQKQPRSARQDVVTAAMPPVPTSAPPTPRGLNLHVVNASHPFRRRPFLDHCSMIGVPGYSGYVRGKEAENVHGLTFQHANNVSAHVDTLRKGNQMPPAKQIRARGHHPTSGPWKSAGMPKPTSMIMPGQQGP